MLHGLYPQHYYLNQNQFQVHRENNNQMKVVSGSNFQDNKKFGEGDYYFSKYAHCWGWATWKRAWLDYDDNMEFWEEFKKSKKWEELHVNSYERKYMSQLGELNEIVDELLEQYIDKYSLRTNDRQYFHLSIFCKKDSTNNCG